ncbi:FHA domain-containing protein [Litoreibacter sp.]|nr:FHA domain-containing protein [Litoreibacter sp.]
MMTLFKRVFESHFTEDVDDKQHEPAPSRSADVEAVSLAPQSAPYEGVTETETVPCAPEKQDPLPSDLAATLSRLEEATGTPPEPQTAQAKQELSLAQRAAEAHAMMTLDRPSPLEQGAVQDVDFSALRPQTETVEPRALMPKVPAPEVEVATPDPTVQPVGRSRGRVKTRLLGFHQGADIKADPFKPAGAEKAAPPDLFPTGWLVVVGGPGKGNALAVYGGVSTIGRGEDQALILDFGDTSISRQNHAAIAYDAEQNKFFLGHGGKSNIIRLNDRPVLSTEELNQGDILRIGETVLRFVALCGDDFKWDGSDDDEE